MSALPRLPARPYLSVVHVPNTVDTSKQICIYQVTLREKEPKNPYLADIQELEAIFDHPIAAPELDLWLLPWLEIGYVLDQITPWEWRVQNPATGQYETVWQKT